MSWPRPLAAALVAGGALAGVALGAATDGPAEMFFLGTAGAVLGATGLLAGRLVARAAAARAELREIGQASPQEFADRLIAAERERLSADIDRELRARLGEILRLASNPGTDLGATAAQVHAATRAASTELRRQLGLLRRTAPGTSERELRPAPGPARADLPLGLGAALLAFAESVLYPVLDGAAPVWARVLITVAAALIGLGRRTAPGASALLFGGLWLAGALLGAPGYGGFWLLLAACPIAFTLGRRGGWSGVACWLFMPAAIAGTLYLADPVNLAINAAAPLLAGLVGLIAGRSDRVAASARTADLSRRDELREPLQQAFVATRDQLARDVHDAVSHAVGVIAVHAGAAELAWPERAEVARHSLDVIVATARAALEELPRAGEERGPDQPEGLVEGFREAGLEVVVQADPVPPDQAPLVSRVVRECLTNVLRHAGASRAEVRIGVTANELTVSVCDDGAGTQPATEGFGLVGVRERVAFAGGSVSAGPAASGGGFQVLARIPLVRSS